MKITIVEGEGPGIKYLTAGTEQVVVVENFSVSFQTEDESEKIERIYNTVEWKTNTDLKEIMDIMNDLESSASHDLDKVQKKIWKTDTQVKEILEGIEKSESKTNYGFGKTLGKIDEREPRGMAVGRKSGNFYRLHPQPDFWKCPDPRSQLNERDLSLSLLTPHYRMHCHNLSSRGLNQELPLYVDERTTGILERKPIREGVNRIEVVTYFNISNTLAELVTMTSPVFTQDKTTKAILIQKFDQLLSQYQKPLKLN